MKKRFLAMFLAPVMCLALAVPAAALVGTGSLKLQRETDHFKFYCVDQDLEALDDLEASFEGCYERVTTDLGKKPPNKTRVNIYPDIKSYHAVTNLPNPTDASVGMAKNGVVYMVSPLNPGSVHDYDDIITVAVHEFVHIVIAQFGRNQPSYLDEGLAAYEAGQNEFLHYLIREDAKNDAVLSLKKLAQLTYSNDKDGKRYTYGYVYVEFIITQFGHDKLIALLEGKNRAQTLGVSDDELNEQWLAYVKEHYVEEKPAEPDKPTTPDTPDTPDKPTVPATATAIPTNDKLIVDGKEVTPAAYKINNANYFMIRDLAALLDGTKSQFAVDWDDATLSATITTGQAYVPQGSELQGRPTANATANLSKDAIYINSEKADLTIYKINNSNYIKLYDLGKVLDFYMSYDGTTKTASIDTTKPYTE